MIEDGNGKRPGTRGGAVGFSIGLLGLRSPETAAHSRRVARRSYQVGRRLGFSKARCRALYLAGLLHDVGKIFSDPAILNKEGPLTPGEREHMELHVRDSVRIVALLEGLDDDLRPAIASHHEHLEGPGGYPREARGDAVPVEARVLSVVDVFDALTERRCYREGVPRGEAVRYLRSREGTQFDRDVVNALVDVLALGAGGRRDGASAERLVGASGGRQDLLQDVLN